MTTEIVPSDHSVATVRAVDANVPTERSADDIVARLKKIQEVQRRAMEKGVDYGEIPGTGKKPTLLKPGAEKLCVLFQLDAQFVGPGNREEIEGPHLTVFRYCTLYHQVTGSRLGGASALCTSKESKYAWRKGERLCPSCLAPKIIKSKYPDRQTGVTGWYCLNCRASFAPNDKLITDQTTDRVPNLDVADQFNTVVRIAEKRALVAATRLVTGASAIFDEEMPDSDDEVRGETVDKSTSQETGDTGVGAEATQTARRGRGRPKADSSVETAARPATEAPNGAAPAQAPTGEPDEKAKISAADAEWLVNEAKATEAMLPAMLKQFGGHDKPEDLTYGNFKKIKNILERRRSIRQGA